MQRVPDERSTTLDYRSPRRERASSKLDMLTEFALAASTLSMVTAAADDGGGTRRDLQVAVGIGIGSFSLLLALGALIRLLIWRKLGTSNLVAAASAVGCAVLAILVGLRLYWR